MKEGYRNQVIPIRHLKELPGVQWKLMNILKMDDQKHKLAIRKLEQVLMKDRG